MIDCPGLDPCMLEICMIGAGQCSEAVYENALTWTLRELVSIGTRMRECETQ